MTGLKTTFAIPSSWHPLKKKGSHKKRLRSAGILRGDSKNDVRPRCEIYATYLKKHLL